MNCLQKIRKIGSICYLLNLPRDWLTAAKKYVNHPGSVLNILDIAPHKEYLRILFSYFSMKTYVVGTD